jgi:tetratricopeptide (TPR) repeat protein
MVLHSANIQVMERSERRRDEFPDPIKRNLALRVNYRCSNPRCGAATSGPQVNSTSFLNVGVAAHITAASPGGPRYNPNISEGQRKSDRNGIWLCQVCAKLVDNDPERFPEEQLRNWKQQAESNAFSMIGVTSPFTAQQIPVGARGPLRNNLWNVPYPRNLYFTGRNSVFKELRKHITESGITGVAQAVSGLGGIGKTQIAVEYAYRYGHEYDAVFWLSADSLEQIASGYAEIARLLALQEITSPDPQIAIDAVRSWLEQHPRWLMIVDNADQPHQIRSFLPRRRPGHLIVTSRSAQLDVLGIPSPIVLDVMDRCTSVDFLITRTGTNENDADQLRAAESISEQLGYLPLALEQASAYIYERGCSLQDYLASLRQRCLSLLDMAIPSTGYTKTIRSAWIMNFADIEHTSAPSADLLRLSAFLAPDGIPLELLERGTTELGPALSKTLTPSEVDPLAVDELLYPLVRYSLVTREQRSFSIHRLLQAVVREQIPPEEQREWARRAVRALNRTFPEASFDKWHLCERLLPHARIAAGLVAQFELTYDDAGFLLNEVAAFMRLRADFEGSQKMHEQSLAVRQRYLPPGHEAIAESLNDTAFLLVDLYRYAEAEPLFRQALAIAQQTLPERDIQLVLYLNNLGNLYVRMSKCKMAESLLNQAEAIARNAPDDRLYMYAVVLNGLAELHLKRAQLREAEHVCRRSITLREKIGNPEKTARSYVTLGEIQHRSGDDQSAEESLRRALALKLNVHGFEHPDLIVTLRRCAGVLRARHKIQEALDLENRADRIRERFNLPAYIEESCNDDHLS